MMKHKNTQSGFTLVEISLVLLILGMITGAVFAFITPMQDLKYRQTTMEKQKKVLLALANFAQQNGRLPCAADPNPAPATNLGIERTGTDCNVINEYDGIVPYRTLGLTQEDALDGWKRPFTYIVDEEARDAPTTTAVHDKCRTVAGLYPWISAGVNSNPNKASFCCQQNQVDNTALRVFNNSGMSQATDLVIANAQGTPGGFSGVNSPPGTDTSSLTYFAVSLISHGKNGRGAYALGQTNRTTPLPAGGSAEAENTDGNTSGDADVLDLPANLTPGNTYFDDIVVWRTQQGLISEFGNDSCNVP